MSTHPRDGHEPVSLRPVSADRQQPAPPGLPRPPPAPGGKSPGGAAAPLPEPDTAPPPGFPPPCPPRTGHRADPHRPQARARHHQLHRERRPRPRHGRRQPCASQDPADPGPAGQENRRPESPAGHPAHPGGILRREPRRASRRRRADCRRDGRRPGSAADRDRCGHPERLAQAPAAAQSPAPDPRPGLRRRRAAAAVLLLRRDQRRLVQPLLGRPGLRHLAGRDGHRYQLRVLPLRRGPAAAVQERRRHRPAAGSGRVHHGWPRSWRW